MSISLVVLRLEIANDTSVVPSLQYTTANFQVTVDGLKLKPKSYSDGQTTHDQVAFSDVLINSCLGFRQFNEITLETYTDIDIMCEMEKHASQSLLSENLTVDDKSKIDINDDVAGTPMCSKDKDPLVSDTDVTTDSVQPQLDAKNITSSWANIVASTENSSKDRFSPSDSKSSPRETSFSPISDESTVDSKARHTRPKSHSPMSKLPPTITFFSGNPSVEITEGILHLYKDSQLTSLTEDVPRSEMLCMLAVPAAMMAKDLLQFIAPVSLWIDNMKIIRDTTPNQYMVLVKFHSQKYADDFYKAFNNKPFNSIEEELCHLVYVAKVETVKASQGASLPVPGLTELPTCPVCLERMDESVDGILTILCNHSFHGSCLAQWADTSCPVCRHVQTPTPTADNYCSECNSTDSLWICLICGHVGCGRYVDGHARTHFEETQHTYSLQLGANRVWDYAGDNYVHRLIQNKGDGKLVEVDEGGNLVEDEKIDSLTLEYTYLLTSQLESQRCYFEEKMALVEKDAHKQMEEVKLRSKATLDRCSQLEKKLSDMTKEKQQCDKKVAQLNAKITKINKQLTEECEMNKSLQQNQKLWQERVFKLENELKQKRDELTDAQDQLRDVMFYLEAQQKFANTTEVTQEEIQEGQIVVGSSPQGATGGKKKTKKR